MSPTRTAALCAIAPAALLAIAGLNTTLLACPPESDGNANAASATAPAARSESPGARSSANRLMTLAQVKELKDQALLLDCREAFAFSAAQAEGVINAPASKMTKAAVAALLGEHKDRELIIVTSPAERTEAMKNAERLSALSERSVSILIAEPVELASALDRPVNVAGKSMSAEAAASAISAERDLASARVNAQEFVRLASEGYTVFDLRPREERVMLPLTLPATKRLSADEFVRVLSKPGLIPMGKLIIVDSRGESLRAVHQHLRASGRTDFKMLDGGVQALKLAGFNGSGERAVAGVETP